MAEIQLSEVQSINIIPSCPEDLEKISKVIDEMVSSMTRAAGETAFQKEACDSLSADFRISKQWIKKAARDRYAGSFDKKVQEQDEYECFYEKLASIKTKKAEI